MEITGISPLNIVAIGRTAAEHDSFEPAMLEAVVSADPKGRFEVDGDQIRATYGHSVDVELEPRDSPVPDVLFHGTEPGAVDAILIEGLRPMNLQHVT